MASILVVDDEKKITVLLEAELAEAGHEVTTATDGDKAIQLLQARRFDVVLTDLRLGRTDGVEVLRAAKKADPAGVVLLMTAYATVSSAVAAMKEGAADYLEKPVNFEKLRLVIDRSLEARRLADENRFLKTRVAAGGVGVNAIVWGQSRRMSELRALVEKVAPTEAMVLLTGESGTGKEVIARVVHEKSARRESSLVTVNCAALAETLLESELFGHEKGSFTDAFERKLGWFEVAARGTILLDEIAETKPSTQAKLLRVLEDRRFHRLGGSAIIEADVRVIAATNRDLTREIQRGRFREDLFYRLNVFPLELPPLRDRLEDLPELCEHFLRRGGYQGPGISASAQSKLAGYSWPGNLRELRNVMERAVILAGDAQITDGDLHIPEEDLGDRIRMAAEGGGGGEAETLRLSEREAEMIRAALEKAGGNKSKAARLLGITRRALYGRLEKYGIEAGDSD